VGVNKTLTAEGLLIGFYMPGNYPLRATLDDIAAMFWWLWLHAKNRLCGLVVGVLGYRSRGPGFGATIFSEK
jgi:hypothetical protein